MAASLFVFGSGLKILFHAIVSSEADFMSACATAVRDSVAASENKQLKTPPTILPQIDLPMQLNALQGRSARVHKAIILSEEGAN
jgi:hypothetical protein